MYLGDSWVINILVATGTLLAIFYYYLTSTYDYWKKRGVPYVKPKLFFGNLKDQFLGKKPAVIVLDDIYKELTGEKFGGYFGLRNPMLMIRDPQLIERILIKDFSLFQNRDLGFGLDMKKNPLLTNLFNTKGQIWKNLRNKLTPAYTSGKLKNMMEQISNCGERLLKEIEENSDTGESVDAKLLGSSYSIDITASISFGLQFDPQSLEGAEFRRIAQSILSPKFSNNLRMLLIVYFRPFTKLFDVRWFPKEVSDYFVNLVRRTIEFRKNNNIQRNDFFQLLMNLRDQEQSGKPLNWTTDLKDEDAYLNQMDYSTKENNLIMTDEFIAAQAFVFVVGGSEAVANSVQFSLYELAANPAVQARLQQEVDSTLAKHDGKLTYECLKEMHYLDLFIQERNRKYTEGAFLHRVCEAPYVIPDTNVTIEKGTHLLIPIYSLHHDPEYYPEPEKFIPERFEGNNFRPSGTYLPFGDGPRMCIAMRFATLEVKACIAMIMSRYAVSLDPRTKVPLEYDPKSAFIFLPKGGIWVKFKRRDIKQDT